MQCFRNWGTVAQREPLDFMIKGINSDILVVELLNLGAGADLDIILWNSNFLQPVCHLVGTTKVAYQIHHLHYLILILSPGLQLKKCLVNKNS